MKDLKELLLFEADSNAFDEDDFYGCIDMFAEEYLCDKYDDISQVGRDYKSGKIDSETLFKWYKSFLKEWFDTDMRSVNATLKKIKCDDTELFMDELYIWIGLTKQDIKKSC